MTIKQQQGQQTQQQPQQSATPPQRQMQQGSDSTQQSQSQSNRDSQTQSQTTPRSFVDPLGRPLHQTSPRFTDQQAGGDLTGDESDARDDNYVVTGSGQNARDVSAHAEKLPAVSAELLRSMAVEPTTDAKVRPPVSEQVAAAEPEPDGTEDPGANADDGLVPRKKDGTGAEQH